jgi:hypothetical protein
MLKEVLPLDKGISFSGTRDRIRVLGMQIDADIERDIVKLPKAAADVQVRESSHVVPVSVDSACLRHCDSVGEQGRHVNIVAMHALFIWVLFVAYLANAKLAFGTGRCENRTILRSWYERPSNSHRKR